MKNYIVFGHLGQYLTTAETFVRAIQIAIQEVGGNAEDWVAHELYSYPDHLICRLVRESEHI